MSLRRWIVVGAVLAAAAGALAAGGRWLAEQNSQMTYAAPAGPGPNQLTLVARGPWLELLDGATQTVLQSRPLAGTQGVTIQGAPGDVDDTLTVDLDGGALALPQGITFDGGAGGY